MQEEDRGFSCAMWAVTRDYIDSGHGGAISTPLQLPSGGESPSTTALSSVPANAAQVFSRPSPWSFRNHTAFGRATNDNLELSRVGLAFDGRQVFDGLPVMEFVVRHGGAAEGLPRCGLAARISFFYPRPLRRFASLSSSPMPLMA